MERRAGLLSAVIAAHAVGLALLAGCSGTEVTLTVTHYRPAATPLSSAVRTLSIGQFISAAGKNGKFAALVKQELSAALRGPQAAKRFQILDSKQVTRRADAVIYGTVTVTPKPQSARDATSEPAACLAEVTFNIVDMRSGRTVLTSTISRQGQCPAGVRAKAGELIGQCIDDFVADITPHEVLISVVLADVKGTIAKKAGAHAAAGRYDRALDFYTRALLQSPDDHGILFNAGVMHEMKGNLVRASGLYAKALQIEPKDKYRAALRRVRRELKKK